MSKRILDPCCGSRMFWFNKQNPDVEFCDMREVDDEVIWQSKDGKQERRLTVNPDTICSVTNLPFDDNTFYHIVLDPPIFFASGKMLGCVRNMGNSMTTGKHLYKMLFQNV